MRRVIDVVGRTALHDTAIAHQGDLVGHAHRLIRFMGHQQDGGPFVFQHLKRRVADAVAQPVIKAGKRLVHQHNAGARGQSAGKGHALLFAARQLVRMLGAKSGQADPFQQRVYPGQPLRFVARKAKGHVLCHRQMREQREILKHQPYAPRLGRAVQAGGSHGGAVYGDYARIGAFHAGDHPQRGGFTAPRRTQQAHDLPRRH